MLSVRWRVKVRSWLDSVGDAYISKKDLGDSLDSAYSLQEECLNIEAQLLVNTPLQPSTTPHYALRPTINADSRLYSDGQSNNTVRRED